MFQNAKAPLNLNSLKKQQHVDLFMHLHDSFVNICRHVDMLTDVKNKTNAGLTEQSISLKVRQKCKNTESFLM